MRKSYPNAPAWVYALVDPLTKNVGYVGVSVMPVARAQTHVDEAQRWLKMEKRFPNPAVSRPQKEAWIIGLLEQGRWPQLVILEETIYATRLEVENRWIQHYDTLGHPLSNIANNSFSSHRGLLPEPQKPQEQP